MSRFWQILGTFVVVSTALLAATGVQATPLHWTLHIDGDPMNVGGARISVVGSFVYDRALDPSGNGSANAYSNFSFTVSGVTAPVGSGLDYTPANGVYDNFSWGSSTLIQLWRDANNNGIVDYGDATLSNQDWGIYVAFDTNWGITDAGGTVGIHVYSIGTCYQGSSGYGPCDTIYPHLGRDGTAADYITTNAVSPSPLPATLPLFLSGLGGLGFIVWRRRKAVAARAA